MRSTLSKKLKALAITTMFAFVARPVVNWCIETKASEKVEVEKLQNLHVKDSYSYRMSEIIAYVDEAYEDGRLDQCRSKKSYVEEWYTHNVLHAFGLYSDRTADVDLNNNETQLRLLGYKLVFWLASGTITYCMYR